MEGTPVSAAEALRAAQVAGVRVMADEGDLLLYAEAPPPTPVLDALRRHKAEIVAILASNADDESAADWQEFFDERAGIAEFDSGLTRADADAQAFECCVVEWLNRNPEPSEPGRCAWCGKPDVSGCAVIPFGTETHGHTWLHPQCWDQWHRSRRARAEDVLKKLGLTSPNTRR
jgi:hypothetical protein